jgi:DNA helicase-2/ATP-dependent DNA helicase PcrA
MNALVLPLTVTWRCPLKVVALAQRIVPDLEAAPGKEEGEVVQVGIEALSSYPFVPDQAILCRNTAPLVAAAYGLIRRGIGCMVEGREIGGGFARLARRWKVETIEELLPKLEDYRETEIQKALAKGSEQKAEQVADKVDTLMEICAAVQAKGQHTIEDLIASIREMFGDTEVEEKRKPLVVLATYHRAKGREWGDVFLIEHSARCPSKAARQAWQMHQESNLAYVAITRAMRSLTFIG